MFGSASAAYGNVFNGRKYLHHRRMFSKHILHAENLALDRVRVKTGGLGLQIKKIFSNIALHAIFILLICNYVE